MPTRAVPQSENPEQAVREATRRFYRALATLDIGPMDQVWPHEDWVQCVHPGGDLMLGWEEVRESWARIFASTQRMQVEISSVWVRVEGDVAWVACTEHITSTFERGFDESLVQATNIFVRRPTEANGWHWQMVAHHASPLPAEPAPTLQ
jgi:ketosteroid isomerase-like protein